MPERINGDAVKSSQAELAEDVISFGQLILSIVATRDWAEDDPALWIVLCLVRSINHLRAVVALAGIGSMIEIEMLSRGCYENLFVICGLKNDGPATVQKLAEDDALSRRKRGEFIHNNNLDAHLPPHRRDRLRKIVDELKRDYSPSQQLAVGTLANKEPDLQHLYIFYRDLCGRAAHPSISSLSRYLITQEQMNADRPIVNDGLSWDSKDIDEAVGLACCPVLTSCILADDVLCNKKHSSTIETLQRRYCSLIESEEAKAAA